MGLHSEVRLGSDFRHRLLWRRGLTPKIDELHVYLDGDGTPWLGPGRPALDPGPRNPMVLRLMAMDPAPALYLGRPCYAGLAGSQGCNAWHWTHGRYSAAVVESLASILRQVLLETDRPKLVLIGYSGGGALAMLLAGRLPETTAVVTLAANLDIDRWVELHGYTPMRSSLNPARLESLPQRIKQLHFVGTDDRNVPSNLLRGGLRTQEHAEVIELPDVDHSCCWEQRWPNLLQRLYGSKS